MSKKARTGTSSLGNLMDIPLDEVHPNPDQPRKVFPARQLGELTASIKTIGLVQPIIVRPLDEGGYQIIAGERRYRAYSTLSEEDEAYGRIPAVIQSLDDKQVAVAALVENVVRDDLNPIERAQALKDLKTQLKTNWQGVANRVGLSKRAVHFLVGMLKLRKEFKDAIAAGQITEKHARALRRLSKHAEAQYDLFEYLVSSENKITGDTAMKIASGMLRYEGLSAEEAHGYLKDEGTQDVMPNPRKGPDATPSMQVTRGLKTFLASVKEVEAKGLSKDERKEILELIDDTRDHLKKLKSRIDKK